MTSNSENIKMVTRYNIETNKWETGYWVGTRFIVVSIVEAV